MREDRKVQSSAHLLKKSRLLNDTATALEIVINKLKPDFEEINNSQKQALVEINKALIPFMRDTSRLLSLSAHPVSPIGGMIYVYQCEEDNKVIEPNNIARMFEKHNRKNVPLDCVEQDFHSNGVMYNKESEIPKGARWLENMVSAAHKNLPINL